MFGLWGGRGLRRAYDTWFIKMMQIEEGMGSELSHETNILCILDNQDR